MRSLAGLSCAALLFAGSAAHAQQVLTWDVNGATAGTGGTGAWNVSSPFWSNGVSYQAWNNAALDDAIFAGSAGTVTLGAPIAVRNMTFNVGGYTLTGSTLSFGGATPTITTNVATTTINSALSGATGFAHNGVGTLALGGNSTGYTGVTTVNAGVLRVNNANALGLSTAATNLVLNNGATFIFGADFTHNYTLTGGVVNVQGGGIFTWSGAPTLTASTNLNFNGVLINATLSGNLADTGANVLSLTRNGVGTTTLSGVNTYTGATTITQGTFQMGSATALSSGSNLVFNGAVGTGGTINLTAASGNFTRGIGAGAGQVQWLGDGGFRSSGTGRVVNIGGAGAPLIWGSGGFVPTGNRLLLGTSSNSLLDFQNGIDLTGGVRAVQGDGGLLTGHARMSGVLSGTGGLAQVGNGLLELTGVNTYSGGTVLASGVLVVSADTNLGAAPGALTFTGGTLLNTGAFTTGRAMTLGGGGTLQTNANLVASGPIDGAGHLTKTGVGMLTLTGANTFAGGTTISAGTLQIGNGGATGSIAGDISNSGVLLLNRSGELTLAGSISGAGTLNQVGAGATTLTGVNTYTGGTTISAGTLQLGDGGVTGGVTGNIVNNGALSFNRSDALTFAGVISGGGLINQVGAGGTTLTGDSSVFSGDAAISNGTLVVNGALGGAASTITVTNGATLAGAGGIGGSVVMNDGVLAPGAGIGTLTIAGDLSLGALSVLNYQLGENDVVGGSLDDLTVVGGDLVLDGTLNVAQSPGGAFGPGLYRVISYGGALTDNGLDIGAMPVGSVDYVQTSVAQQVNLVNGQGLTLNYWDGGAGARNDNVVEGGAGVWQGNAGNDNWTEASGAINAPYTDAAFAIFAGAPGAVSVDDSLGDISVSGMQFASDGYRIQGDSINLVAGVNVIRVGDGSLAGAGHSATIAAALVGVGGLDAADLGTLVLSGSNTYAGGTTISAGTLQIGDGGVTGSILGDVANDSVLAFNRSDDITFDGVISGSGRLDQLGAGVLTLTGANLYTGGTAISGGTLQIGNGGTSGSIVSDIADDGVLRLNRSDALTLAGDISGGGALEQVGAGVLTLTGANTYTGGTIISAGTLQIGDGGVTGSIAGDIANDSVLAFNRSDALTFAGDISGDGDISQVGAGSVTLSGDSSAFSGGTVVTNGSLIVNGALGAAGSDLSVSNGATLAGAGIVGGSVVITDGVLASGDGLGTLTISGDLTLGASSVLDYQFGQAGVVGGPLNDLTIVGGDLVLDGTLNVTQSSGGAFGPGLYRVISYSDSLTDNGLDLGAMPGGSQNFLQTSVAQQINLVNAQGLTLNYWDGDAGPRNNGVIDGGAGVWTAINDNWTEATGAVNAPYTDAAFSIFAGAPGTVTVDNSFGDISVGGMQFASDGYRIEGDAIILAAGENVIRVGDGTSAGAGYVATVASVLTGPGGLDAADLGTLVLTGDNTYAGGTTISAGTLQLGDGGTTGAIVGDVTNDGVLAFNRLDDVIFAAVISGAGALDQRGGGLLTLTGENTYTGGTTINAGTLQIGSGGTTGSIVGDIDNESYLLLNRSDTLTLAGDISGDGALYQIGNGVLSLTGANTYTGGTTISAGTLQIGDGGATGSIVGDISNESVLAFNRAGELTMAGEISGAGSLVQAGSGMTILTGDNSYAGGTTISAGALQIGDGGVAGSIVGDVVNDGVFAFDRSDAITFADVISGGGEFEQRGDGALTLTGDSGAFAGHTSVVGGTLIVNNRLGGALSVLSGGRVEGVGTLGTTDVASGGTLAAGSPFGTLTIAGDVSFAEGSTYEINLGPEDAVTLLHVLGAATIDGGAVSVAGGVYRIGERYTILTADLGLAGQFNDLTGLLPLLEVSLAYDLNHVYLDIERVSATFCAFAVTRNQCATSSAFNTLDPDNPVYIAALSSPDLISAQRALDALSGEVYATERTVRLEDSRVLRDAILDQSARSFDASAGRGVNVWAQAFGATGRQSEDGNAAAAETSIGGVIVGADAPVNDNLRLGVAGGYSASAVDVSARRASTSSDDYHLAAYGGARFGALGFRFGAAQSWHDVSADRNVQFLGFADEVTADYGAQTTQIYGEAGYAFSFGPLEIEPFARVAHVRVSTDGFSEGDSPAALSVAGGDGEAVFTTLGVHAARTLLVSDWSVTMRGTLGWRRASGDLAPMSTNAIADSADFTIAGLSITDEALILDVGFDVAVADNVTLGFAYNRQSSDESSYDGARANLTLRF